jgi:3-deoxy-7-phosphoheptulonate synthase
MIVSMKLHAKREDIQAVCDRAQEFGYKVHSIEGEERVVIASSGWAM